MTDKLAVTNYHWKFMAAPNKDGYYDLKTEDTRDVPVRMFLSQKLLVDMENDLYPQIINATRFPGVKLVVITPDVHSGFGVPIGCVIVTDSTVALGPTGYDIGCGMISLGSDVEAAKATPALRTQFNNEVMVRVGMGLGSQGGLFKNINRDNFLRLMRGGAELYIKNYSHMFDVGSLEKTSLRVPDNWDIPKHCRAERGISQLGSLGGGNHFIELQSCFETGTLFAQIHTGSRGFGHGLANYYFQRARAENPAITALDLGYFTPESPSYTDYISAVAAGRNFAAINRLMIAEQVAEAFKAVFGSEMGLIAEISHNLVQKETTEFGSAWIHRKGATRAFPAGHPDLLGTGWYDDGYPILVPGSNRDYSYILKAESGAATSAYSVNHGAGRKMSRGAAKKTLDQATVNQDYKDDGVIVNAGGNVPLDESDGCYKASAEIIKALLCANLASVEYTLWPLASLKGLD